MRFIKTNWIKVRLEEVCTKAQCVDIRKQTGFFNYIDIGSIDSASKRISTIQQIDCAKASTRARQVIRKDDILFSTVRVNLERIAYVENDISDGIASTGFTVLRSNGQIVPEYLFYAVISPKFIENLIHLQKGTAYPAVTDKIVLNEEIFLPHPEEQKQIAYLFKAIENFITHIEIQEEKIKSLQKILINGLSGEESHFGNLLSENNTVQIKFGEAAECIEKHDKEKRGLTRYVGLEDIESGSFSIESWGNILDGTTFTKRFNTGDVLFGKRRSYLKKVAIADFDGICSGDILVFRAKEGKILPGLLPYCVASDAFIQHAVATSAGSLSPRTKWKDLKEFTVSMPDLQTQGKVLDVFNQIQTVLNQIKDQKGTLKTLKKNLLNEILG